MRQKYLAILITFILTCPCFAQLNIKEISTDKLLIQGLSEVEISGNNVYSRTSATGAVPFGRIVIDPEGSIIFLGSVYDRDTQRHVDITREDKDGLVILTWVNPAPLKIKIISLNFAKSGGSEQIIDAQIKPPLTPTPQPTPEPPKPDLIKLDKLSVLFYFESGDLPKYDDSTRQILQSTELKTWFQKELPEPGGLSRVRWYDIDTKFTQCVNVQCKWMSSLPPELPGMVVGNEEQIIYKGKLLTIDEIKNLITKHKK